ncbi:hypothetical protein [Rhizobium leguminosarum]|uniref:hypothetical protein n=1 Tax=Rhizobium leguminosarum TaxID=384 RepID=UPI001442486C|nr:hypothetical protein [Rhizobium leguminosarum]MBY5819231.1 hypothetical protein [Rhizobium leguminosarum]NKK97082.1 hypothetical protein [Rhizobium leguminosarum bv. viciae]NKL79404.1 hypothetical protein [Rhizobium leguminosarum bv. viciae]
MWRGGWPDVVAVVGDWRQVGQLVIALFDISVNSAVSQMEMSEAAPSGEGLGKAGPGRIVVDR